MTTAHLDSEVRKHQIVQSARKIVANHGMSFFTIQELSKEVGVSEGAIYRHFKSKDEILLALMQDIERNLLQAISDSARPKEGSLDQLKHLMDRHFSARGRRNGVSFVVMAEALCFADQQVKHATRQVLEHYLETVSAILSSGRENGEIDETIDPQAAALMFFGMIQSSVTLWSFSNRAHPLTHHSGPLWAVFRDGLQPRSNKRKRSESETAVAKSTTKK